MFWWQPMAGGGWGVMILGLIVTMLLVFLVGYALWRSAGGRVDGVGGTSPQDTLAQRFARGEIDAEEYRRRLDTLREARSAR